MDYAFPGIIIPCVIMVGLFAAGMWLSRFFSRKKYSLGIILTPVILLFALFYVVLIRYHSGFNAPVISVFQMDSPRFITVGMIEDIHSPYNLPLYYNRQKKTLEPAQILTIHGDQYYIRNSNLEVSQWVEITWATEARIVYALELIQPGEKNSGTYAVTESSEPKQYDTSFLGKRVLSFSAVLFVLFIILQYPIGYFVSDYFEKKDRMYSGPVVPNRLGLLYAVLMPVPVLGLLLGLYLRGLTGIPIIILFAFIPIIRILIIKQTTVVKYDGDTLSVLEYKTVRKLPAQDIASVSWVRSSLPFNRCLVISFSNGYSLSLEQEYFWGLEELHNTIAHRTRDR
jgi:hypothetical protein